MITSVRQSSNVMLNVTLFCFSEVGVSLALLYHHSIFATCFTRSCGITSHIDVYNRVVVLQVFRNYLTFCGIGLTNAQLFEMSVQEYKRNQVRNALHFQLFLVVNFKIAFALQCSYNDKFCCRSRYLGAVKKKHGDQHKLCKFSPTKNA